MRYAAVAGGNAPGDMTIRMDKLQKLLKRALNNQPPAATARASVLTSTESQANHIMDETESLKKRVAAMRGSRWATSMICCVDDITISTTTPAAG